MLGLSHCTPLLLPMPVILSLRRCNDLPQWLEVHNVGQRQWCGSQQLCSDAPWCVVVQELPLGQPQWEIWGEQAQWGEWQSFDCQLFSLAWEKHMEGGVASGQVAHAIWTHFVLKDNDPWGNSWILLESEGLKLTTCFLWWTETPKVELS